MRLYVGGLPYSTREQDLFDLFGQIGEVTQATVVMDRETGRSKGFGFVEYSNDEDARAAIAQLNGSLVGNRNITVSEARERQSGGGGGSRGGYQRRDNRSDRGGYGRDRY
jgi:RNA recognition motif-containing protein